MVIVNLIGGLGNQMFQYAFGRYVSLKLNMPLFLNTETYNSIESNRTFDLDIFSLSKTRTIDKLTILELFVGRKMYHFKESKFEFDEILFANLENMSVEKESIIAISGYWQSEKYFSSIYDVIRRDFTLNFELEHQVKDLLNFILKSNSVMINVRRGDFLTKLEYHGVVSIEYIEKGIKYMRQRLTGPYFFIFSDDIAWCRANITFSDDIIFVDESFYGQKFKVYLKLMTSCKHFIISNSTFAWWAAWLSPSEQKIVIAPQQWFALAEIETKDLLPKSWLKI